MPIPKPVPTPSGTNAQGYDKIKYGQKGKKTGIAKVGQARNQPGFVPRGQREGGTPGYPGGNGPAGSGGGTAAGDLPKLTEALRGELERRFDEEGNFGTASGPSEAAVRRLMRQGLASGLTEKQVGNFLNPAFYRGIGDPFGGGRLLKDLTPEQLKALSVYAGKQQGSGLVQGGSTGAQAAFFEAFPDLQTKYIQLANSYNKAPDPANAMSTTPPNAVLGSDGKWHDPYMALPEGVTIEGGPLTHPTAAPGTEETGRRLERSAAERTGDGALKFQPFTGMTGEQTGVAGYPLTSYADYGSAMTAAQGMLASHYASAAAAGDFTSAGTAFTALQAHNDFVNSQGSANPAAPSATPDTFSERDLYQTTQYQ